MNSKSQRVHADYHEAPGLLEVSEIGLLSAARMSASGRARVILGECVAAMREMEADSVDAVVTDPPYAIRAPRPVDDLGSASGPRLCSCEESDGPCADLAVCRAAREERSLLEASMLGMQSQNWHERATHSRGYADNDPAVFQQWCGLWLKECFRLLKPGGHLVAFGGTRSWHRLVCAVEDAGFEVRDSLGWVYSSGFPKSLDLGARIKTSQETPRPGVPRVEVSASARALDDGQLDGWGTALKPAFEPIVLARKPPVGTVTANAIRFGTGGLNIQGCRVADPEDAKGRDRWPTNVFLDSEQADVLTTAQLGLASRFFWVSKPSPRERVGVGEVVHPMVKPLDLMRQLVRLVTPPGGLVLDPFAGSGTTVEAALLEDACVLAMERDERYLRLIDRRVERALQAAPLKAPVDLADSLESGTLF